MRNILMLALMLVATIVHADGQRKLGDGTIAQGVTVLSKNGAIANPVPIFQQDLVGSAKNFYPDKTRGFVFGKRSLIANTTVDLWEGPTDRYVFPTAPIQMSIVSTSASDAAAGTGLQQILIHYLDQNYNAKIIPITLNGITPVLTSVSNILRINAVHAIAVGSGKSAAGTVSVTSVGGAITYAVISTGFNTSRQAIYTVPNGYNGYITHWQNSSGSTGSHFTQISVVATTHDGILYPGVFLLQDEQGSQNGGSIVDLPIPILIPPLCDVKLSAVSDAPNANVIALGAVMGWFEAIAE